MKNNEYLTKIIVNHSLNLIIYDLFSYIYARLLHNRFFLLFDNILKILYNKKFTFKKELLN